ncbi:PREDICTED: protein NEN1-like [Populus euphratica]|uniref:Protein NEN1-like n=1 Tax=Populus euphratica TaxID=75702 RepID=A0AAJ6SWX3_POPEU|nr:PREDICTED: protein NEN1-like [Populus euphratica]
MENKTEIAFFDVETTVPTRPGQGYAILEFGAIIVCPQKLEEIRSYSTLVRPSNPKLISSLSVRCHGIIPQAVVSAPSFADIADTVYDILHGRIWAGYNIVRFDCVRIKEAFAEIGRAAPEPKGTIDSLALLTQKFGRRAGNMEMASLATYFGLGNQTHRSLDDIRMNLEVLKRCATVLFLESSLPDTFPENHWVSPNAITRNRRNGKSPGLDKNSPSTSSNVKSTPALSPENDRTEGKRPVFSPLTSSTAEAQYSVNSNTAHPDTFDMVAIGNEVNAASFQPDVAMEENPILQRPEMPSTVTVPESCSDVLRFLELDEVSLSSIRACLVPLFRGSHRIKLFYEGAILQLRCPRMRIRFGLGTKFSDHAGRPRLSFVVDASPSLCHVLETCESIVQKVCADSDCSSDWRSVVTRKQGFVNNPTVRLNIPTAVSGDVAQYATDIYQKEPSGTIQKLIFSKFDATELDTWFTPGTFVDAYLSLDPYDYQQTSGIRLVAKKLIIHNE